MIKITRFNHAALSTRDASAMADFYQGHFGIGTSERDLPEEFKAVIPGFWLQLNNAQVHVIQTDSPPEAGSPLGPHIAFYVEDLDAAEQYLTEHSLPCTRLDAVIFTQDPSGNTVELQQDPDIL